MKRAKTSDPLEEYIANGNRPVYIDGKPMEIDSTTEGDTEVVRWRPVRAMMVCAPPPSKSAVLGVIQAKPIYVPTVRLTEEDHLLTRARKFLLP